jgi:hypothetical protein
MLPNEEWRRSPAAGIYPIYIPEIYEIRDIILFIQKYIKIRVSVFLSPDI